MQNTSPKNENIKISEIENHENNKISNDELNEIVSILKKSHKDRTIQELDIICNNTKDILFFKNILEKYGEKIHRSLCQNLIYMFLKKDETLFEAGTYGTMFYIILNGTVALYTKSDKSRPEIQQETLLHEGKSLGELAIIGDVLKPRSHTVIAMEDCHLAILERKSYKEILGLESKKELESKIEFINSISVFKNWSDHALRSLTYYFSPRKYYHKQIIYKEGDEVQEIFIIKSGEVTVTKNIDIKKYIDMSDSDEIIIDNKSQVYTYDKESLSRNLELGIITPGQIFGEEEAYFSYRRDNIHKEKERERRRKSCIEKSDIDDSIKIIDGYIKERNMDMILRESSIICNSDQAEIWSIPSKVFFWKLDKHNFDSLPILRNIIASKLEWRNNRINEFIKTISTHMNYLMCKSYNISKSALNQNIIQTIKQKQFSKFIDQKKFILPLDSNENVIIPLEIKENFNNITQKNSHRRILSANETKEKNILSLYDCQSNNVSYTHMNTHLHSIDMLGKFTSIKSGQTTRKNSYSPFGHIDNDVQNSFFNTSIGISLSKKSNKLNNYIEMKGGYYNQGNKMSYMNKLKKRDSFIYSNKKVKIEGANEIIEHAHNEDIIKNIKHITSKISEYKPETYLIEKSGAHSRVKKFAVVYRSQTPTPRCIIQNSAQYIRPINDIQISQSDQKRMDNTKIQENEKVELYDLSIFQNSLINPNSKVNIPQGFPNKFLDSNSSIKNHVLNTIHRESSIEPANSKSMRNNESPKKYISSEHKAKYIYQSEEKKRIQYITLAGCNPIEKNTLSPQKNKLFQQNLVKLIGRKKFAQRIRHLEGNDNNNNNNNKLLSSLYC